MTADFSKYLFWDTDPETIDPEKNAPFIVNRVLNFGQMRDWQLLQEVFGLVRIIKIAKQLRTLDPKALSFLSVITGIPETEFRCYAGSNQTGQKPEVTENKKKEKQVNPAEK